MALEIHAQLSEKLRSIQIDKDDGMIEEDEDFSSLEHLDVQLLHFMKLIHERNEKRKADYKLKETKEEEDEDDVDVDVDEDDVDDDEDDVDVDVDALVDDDEELVCERCDVCLAEKQHWTFVCPYLKHIENPNVAQIGPGYDIICHCCDNISMHPDPSDTNWVGRAVQRSCAECEGFGHWAFDCPLLNDLERAQSRDMYFSLTV